MPLPQCFPPSRPSPYGLVRLPGCKHLYRGILPAPIRTAGSPDSRLPSGPSGQCPASRPQTCRPKAEDCRLRRQSSASGQFAIRSLADRSSAVIVLLIVLVHYSLDIPACVITLHSFTTLLLYALKKNKKSAKVVRLMVSVKVRRLTPSALRNLDRHQHRTEKAILFLFLFFPVFLFLFFRKFFKCLFS